MGPVPLGGSCEKGKVPSPREPPSLAGRSARTEREIQRLRGECSSWTAAGKTERDQYRGSWPNPCAPQPKMSICWCMQGLGAETGFRGQSLGEDWGWKCGDSLKGLECGPSHNRGCAGRVCH